MPGKEQTLLLIGCFRDQQTNWSWLGTFCSLIDLFLKVSDLVIVARDGQYHLFFPFTVLYGHLFNEVFAKVGLGDDQFLY